MATVRRWFPFMLNNEVDMLYCQMVEHYEDVHRFIVTEATVTHQGRPKPLYYGDNKSRFSAFEDKILHVVVDWFPTREQVIARTGSDNPWMREQSQRDAAMAAFMNDTDPLDVVIVADVDEIPSRAAMRAIPKPFLGLNLSLRFCAVDWWGSKGVNGVLAQAGAVRSIDQLRQHRAEFPVFVDEEGSDFGGWHFSWFGGPDVIRNKLECFCHLEAYESGMAANDGGFMFQRGMGAAPPPDADPDDPSIQGIPAPVDATYPQWVQQAWDYQLQRRRIGAEVPRIWFRPQPKAVAEDGQLWPYDPFGTDEEEAAAHPLNNQGLRIR